MDTRKVAAFLTLIALAFSACSSPRKGTGSDLSAVTVAAPGIIAPVTGQVPVTAIAETEQYTGTVAWEPNHATFQALTAYTATITLTAKPGFTLHGSTADFFTVEGAISISDTIDSGTITVVFPATSGVISDPSKLTPVIRAWPTAASITYGAQLSASLLSGGSANVPGTFSWGNDTIIPTVANRGYEVPFIPEDTATYNTVTRIISIAVSKAVPEVTWPSGLAGIYGQTLASVTLPGNGASDPEGTFTWTSSSTPLGAMGLQSHNMTFTPADTANYTVVTSNITILVQLGVEMVQLRAGTFTMGSPGSEASGGSNERPMHSVTLSAFQMGKHEVTQRQYQIVTGSNPSIFTTAAAGENATRLPVEQVSWYDAIVFCNKLSMLEELTPAYRISDSTDPEEWGPVPASSDATWNAVQVVPGSSGYRLPTEAQWEYACRAGTTGPFSTGDNITTDQANYNGNHPYNNNAVGEYRQRTTPVDTFPANPWGLHDMHGNVYEWCWDWYGMYSRGAETNPQGPLSGASRVSRGGSWYTSGQYLNSAYRYDPSYKSSSIGFRVARP